MSKGKSQLIAFIGILTVLIVVGVVFYSAGANNNPSPRVSPTTKITPIPPSNSTTTSTSGYTVTYSELSKNKTMNKTV